MTATPPSPTRASGWWRALRSIVAPSDLPNDAPATYDETVTIGSVAAVIGAFLLAVVVAVVVSAALGGGRAWVGWVALGAAVVVFLAVSIGLVANLSGIAARRLVARTARLEQDARGLGWTWIGDGPAAPATVLESTFWETRVPLVAPSTSRMITGVERGASFAAYSLDGAETDPDRPNAVRSGTLRTENVVELQLRAPLPELKLRDRTTSYAFDFGIRLPVLPMPPGPAAERWEVQTAYPDFAADLLDSRMQAFLAALPRVPMSIVIRDGRVIAYRDPIGDAASIDLRVRVLRDLVDAIPERCFARPVSPEVAGAGTRNHPRARVTGPVLFRRS